MGGATVRTPYTQEEDTFLAKYIATYNPGKPGRSGNALYKRLVENEDKKWPWSKHHSWQSWRQRYLDNELRFDARIKLYQKQKGLRPSGGDGKDGEGAGEEQELDIHSSPPKPTRQPFSRDDETLLIKYIATYNPAKSGRSGNLLYKQLIEDVDGKWGWSKRHPWQSWRDYYTRNEEKLDAAIRQYQKKKGIAPRGASEAAPKVRVAKEKGREVEKTMEVREVAGPSRNPGLLSESAKPNQSSSPQRKTPSVTRSAKQKRDSKQQAAADDLGGGEPTVARGTSDKSPKDYNHVARKTARKTVIHRAHSETEDEGGDIDRGETSAGRNTTRKRKTVEESKEESRTKRRKVLRESQANGTRPVNDSDLAGHAETEFEMARDEVSNDNTNGLASQGPGTQKLSSPVRRTLVLLSTLDSLEHFLEDERARDSVFKALQLSAEEQSEVVAYAKSQGPKLQSSTPTKDKDGEGDYERLYPQLSPEEDKELALENDALPGAWENEPEPDAGSPKSSPGKTIPPSPTSVSLSESLRNPISPPSVSQRVSSMSPSVHSSSSSPSQKPATFHLASGDKATVAQSPERLQNLVRSSARAVSTSSGMHSTSNEPRRMDNLSLSPVTLPSVKAPSLHPRSAKTVDADSFEIPSPSPDKQGVNDPLKASSRVSRVRDDADDDDDPPRTSQTTVPKRNLTQLANGLGTTTKLPPTRRSIHSKKKGLEFDSDSEADAAVSAQKSVEKLWPPRRRTKGIENRGSLAESTPARKASTIDPVLATKLQGASPTRLPREQAVFAEPTIRSPPHLEDVIKVTPPASPTHNQANGHVHSIIPSLSLRKDKSEPRPAHIEPEVAPVAGPSRYEGSLDETSTKREWRLETPLSEGQAPSASMSAVSDPFLTADHVKRLRKDEKGKNKEKENSSTGTRDDAKANRRMTFGGFSALGPPEFDLRRKALRTSFAANPESLDSRRSISFLDSSMEIVKGRENGHTSNTARNRQTSLASTIDLTLEFPAPGVTISSSDQVLVDRAGLQFFIQSMAENHSVSEDWVRRVYEKCNDLQATDRIVAKMRDAAEGAFEEAIVHESSNRFRDADVAASTSTPRRSFTNRQRRTSESSAKPSPVSREVDLSMVSAQQDRSTSRRRSELFYTPAEQDATLARVRDQYAPPRSSRAAQYMRARARKSSAMMDSPLMPNGDVEELGKNQVEDDDDEKEEAEVTMSLTPAPKSFDFDHSNDSVSLDDVFASQEHVSLPNERGNSRENTEEIKSAPKARHWTAEEDQVLIIGEDEDAIKEIIERRGKMAVKWRLVELDDAAMLS